MFYTLLIKKHAKKTLQAMSRLERSRITEKIVLLGKNPDDLKLDVKKMQGEQFFRLRVGKWRIIFDRADELKLSL